MFNKHCPVKQVLRKHCVKNKPWFTKGLKRACANKKRLYKAFSISRSGEAEHKYKTCKK